MNRNIALVVTDFDGTLWSEDHVIHHRSLQAMHSLLASGVILLGATARRPGTAQTILKRHGMELPTVYFDGSLAVDLDTHSVFHSVDRQYGGFTISVRPYGVNKWTAVEAFIARRGITDGAVLAIGDGENDLELLTNADVSCAVAGACQAVLNVGTYNVGPPDQGGWAAIMDLVQRAESPG